MSDKVIFHPDGSYSRGEDVENLDVERRPQTLTDLARNFKPASNSAGPRPTAQSRPSFSLDELRSFAVRASEKMAPTTLPAENAVSLSSVAESKVEPVAAPQPEVVPEVGTLSVSSVTEQQETVQEVTASEPAVENRKETEETAMPEAESYSATPAVSEPSYSPATQPATTSEDVNMLKLENSEPDFFDGRPATPVAPATSEYSGIGFRVVPFREFLSKVSKDAQTLAKWCGKCVSRAVSMPATIFSAAFDENIRFYNFSFGRSSQWFLAVIGHGDDIACIEINSKSGAIEDARNQARVEDNGNKVTVHGQVMAIYSERLRDAVRV